MRHWLAVPVTLLLLSACATSGTKSAPPKQDKNVMSASGTKSAAPKQDKNVISTDEIVRSAEHNALTLIRAVRPGMLTQRGNTSLSNQDPGIVVFLDEQRYGDVSSLEGIEATTISEIRYFSAAQAQSRFGTGFPQGVILVTSRTQ